MAGLLGVKQQTMGNKGRLIMDALRISVLDPEWSRQEVIERNPLAWLVEFNGLLLDARAGQRYRGEAEPVDPVAGHIPGAVSAPTTRNANPDGTFRAPAELAARFTTLGAAPSTNPPADAPADAPGAGTPPAALVGAYCGSGVTAAHEVLALALAGIPAALYVGSWSDWITDPARPIATGP